MRKILVFIFLFSVISYLLSASAFAQEPGGWVDKSPEQFGEALDKARGEDGEEKQVNKEAWTFDTTSDLMQSANCMIIGLGCTAKTENQGYYLQNSAIGMTGNLIASMYANPPASTAYYAYDLLQNAGFVPKAYAQGIGFSGLSPILPLWKAFRNISYMILVVVLIAIGLMIMFRLKIDPQTVISIQNSLPKIVVTLILITFSYAIAGFLIDLMYLVLLLVINVFGSTGLIKNVPGIQEHYLTGGLPKLFGAVFGGGLRSVDDLVKGLIGAPEGVSDIFKNLIGAGSSGLAGIIIGVIQAVGGVVGTVIFTILISLALLFSFVRIFFALLTSYIQIILSIIFAPVHILLGAFPGRGGFDGWIRGLMANLVVFPVAAGIFLLGTILTTNNQGNLWVAPLLPHQVGNAMAGLIGLGLVMMTPSLINAVKELFAAKPALPISPGMIIAPVVGAGTSIWNLAYQTLMFKSLLRGGQRAKEETLGGGAKPGA